MTNKTFAANIYELLRSSFYLESNIGDYSEKKINEILGKLNKIMELKDLEGNKKEFQKLKKEFTEKDYFSVIKIIGDRIVRNKILDVYFKCFDDDYSGRKEFLKSQISLFQSELENLNND